MGLKLIILVSKDGKNVQERLFNGGPKWFILSNI